MATMPHQGHMVGEDTYEDAEEEDDYEDLEIIDADELQRLEQVGDGQTSIVYRGTYRGVEVAIKELHDLGAMKPKDRLNLEREISILRSVAHENLLALIGFTEHKGKIRIVTDFCRGGDVFDLVHNSGMELEWAQRLKIALDVTAAMEYMHSCDPVIIHRDLKSLNLLLTAPVRHVEDIPLVKVADFGLARMMETFSGMTKDVGTYHWMAPEVLTMEQYNYKVDIYSFSMVLYELICTAVPFAEVDVKRLCLMVVDGHRPDLSKVPPECPDYLRDMMIACWADEPEHRPDSATMRLQILNAAAP